MPDFTKFEDLDDEGFFVSFVAEFFENNWPELDGLIMYTSTVDVERVRYAFKEYQQTIKKFSLMLHSANPDHYKRAGALLHALYQSKVIVSIDFDDAVRDGLEDNSLLGLSKADSDFRLKFVQFFDEYHNEIKSFDLAFRCCSTYEPTEKIYTADFAQCVSHYLKTNSNLNVDSLMMLFKAYMA